MNLLSKLARVTVVGLVTALAACGIGLRGGPGSTMNAVAGVSPATKPDMRAPPISGPALTEAAVNLLNCGENVGCKEFVIDERLMLIDDSYHAFVTRLNQEKTNSDLASGLVELVLGVAGTMSHSITAKTNLAAAGTVVSGSEAVFNQSVFFEKTVTALIAAMDAARAQVRLNIRTSIKNGFDQYPVSDVYRDLIAYERAGTLLGAIGYVQTSSKNAQDSSDKEIRAIVKLTPAQLSEKVCSGNSLGISNKQNWTAEAMRNVADTVGVKVDQNDLYDAVAIAKDIRTFNQGNPSSDDIHKLFLALKNNNLLIKSCVTP